MRETWRASLQRGGRRAVVVMAVALCAGTALAADGDGKVLRQLGSDRAEVEGMIASNLHGGGFSYPGGARAVPVGQRAAVVRALATLAKVYLRSPAYLKAYAAERDVAKPELPQEAMTPAERRAEEIAEGKRALAAMVTQCAGLTGESQALCERGLGDARKAVADLEKMPVARMEDLDPEERSTIEAARRAHDAATSAWQAKYPAGDPTRLLRARLGEFLEVTRDVDFSAKVIDAEGRKVFAKAEDEARPSGWKAAYRAGKEATAAARSAAEAWLAELGPGKPAAKAPAGK